MRERTVLICALALTVCCHPLRSAPATYGTGDVTLQLQAGRNLVSIPVTPRQTNPADLFAPLGANLLGAYAYVRTDTNETWLSYSPLHPAFLNTLQEIQAGQALVIDVSSNATLVVAGEPLESVRVELRQGWNLIGYNGYANHGAAEVFGFATNGLGANAIELVWTLGADGQWTNYPATDPNLIVEPGKAYWLYLKSLAGSIIWFLTDGLHYLVENSCADLQVQDIWVSTNGCGSGEAAPLEFQAVTLCARVTNAAAVPSQIGKTSFYAANPNSGGFQKLGSVDFAALGGHSSVDLSLSCTGLAFQTILKVVADDWPMRLGNTFELKELNNRRIEGVHIRMPDLALAASELEILPPFPHSQSVVSFADVVVSNVGDADAPGSVYREQYALVDPNTGEETIRYWGHRTLPALAPGASTTVHGPTIYWYGETTGLHRFKVEVDRGNSIHESDDVHNNVRSRLVNVTTPPDLTFQEFYFSGWDSPKGPKAGENVRVHVTAQNTGGQAATNVIATFDALNQNSELWCPDPNDSSTWTNVTLIPDIAPNGVAGTYNWLMSVPQGNNDIRVVMDYHDLNGDLRRSATNDRSFTARGPLPDLTPATVETASMIVNDTDHPEFTVRVRNLGETAVSPTNDFWVGLFHSTNYPPWTFSGTNLTTIGWQHVTGGLPVYDGTSATERQLTYTCTSGLGTPPAWRQIVAWVDPWRQVEELYELNDQWWTSVFVRDTRADLRPTHLQAQPLNPLATQQATLRCEVVNDGATSATFNTTFYSNNVLVGVGGPVTLAPGQYRIVSVPVVFPEEGVYTLRAKVDEPDLVSESNETNNVIEAKVHVRPEPVAVKWRADGCWVDHADLDYDYAVSEVPSGLKGQAWCMARSEEGCGVHTCDAWGVSYPCLSFCDFQDRATIRMAVYRTFQVTGPDGTATAADVSLDLCVLGILDRFRPIGGMGYWKVRVVAGLTQGNMDSEQTLKLDAPIKQSVLVDDDSGSLFDESIEATVMELAVAGLEAAEMEVARPAVMVAEFLCCDATVIAPGRATLTNVTLAASQEYTAFVYVDLVTTAVGLSAFTYGDFYYHQPFNDPEATKKFQDRGIWLKNLIVNFH